MTIFNSYVSLPEGKTLPISILVWRVLRRHDQSLGIPGIPTFASRGRSGNSLAASFTGCMAHPQRRVPSGPSQSSSWATRHRKEKTSHRMVTNYVAYCGTLMFMNCCLHMFTIACLGLWVNTFSRPFPNGWTPKSPNPASPGGVAPRLSSILIPFLAVAPSTAGRQALALHRWRRSERNPRPLRSPRLSHWRRAIHWPCGHAVTWEIHHVVICHTWSYPIGVLGLYIMFNLIKSQFSNFPWHRIWPYSKKIRMKSPCSNPHVPMFRVILDDFSYHITSYNRSLWRGHGDLVCIRISLVAHSR